MFGLQMQYEEPVFRPPSEAYSLILQVTIGCSWNKCAFCEMYSTKQFRMRKFEEIKRDIDSICRIDNTIPKIFLADGNAMVMPSKRLLEVLNYLNASFPNLRRISAYALPQDLISKTPDELLAIREAGLRLIYVGIESGDDEVLQHINKGETAESTVLGLQKAQNAGIETSVMIINGLGGNKFSQQHALYSAKVVSEINPKYLATLVLSFPLGKDAYLRKFKGEFEEMTKKELFMEMKEFLSNLTLENTVFRSDHASNYLVLRGTLNRDKQKLLAMVDKMIDEPDSPDLRKEWMRGL